MIDNSFEAILAKIISERGIAVLGNPTKCNGLLQDYANGGNKREIRLLLQALEAGYHKVLIDSAEPEITGSILVKKFHDEYGTSKEVAEEIVGILAKVLEDGGRSEEEKSADRIVILKKTAECGDIQAQYDLGVLLRKLKRFEEAAEWLELSAKRGLELYAELKQRDNGNPDNVKKTPPTISVENVQSIPDNMVLINGGTFMMGSPANEPGRIFDENPHQVTVSSFYIGKYQVTQKEYGEVTGMNPSHFRGGKLPVERVSWFDAIAYCNRLSQREGLMPVYTINGKNVAWNRIANGYRLPLEEEWEYACRAGTTTPFSTGYNITTSQANYINYLNNTLSIEECGWKTMPVGSFPPNAWGLYDMHGNVFEWCWDWYEKNSGGIEADPTDASSKIGRVNRRGSWAISASVIRSAYRNYNAPSICVDQLGFRLARNLE